MKCICFKYSFVYAMVDGAAVNLIHTADFANEIDSPAIGIKMQIHIMCT